MNSSYMSVDGQSGTYSSHTDTLTMGLLRDWGQHFTARQPLLSCITDL